MIAIPQRKLWTPWATPAPRRPLRDKRSWLRRLIDPLAAYASGDILLDGSGNLWLDPSGKIILDDGTGNCCVCPARLCSTGALTTLMMPKSSIPSFPYYVQRSADSQCYYFLSTDTPRPLACGGTLIGTVTAVSGCSDSACTGGGGGYCDLLALVSFSGINNCPGGCGYGIFFDNIVENVSGPTFCLPCCSAAGYPTYYCFCDNSTSYQAAYGGACGSPTGAAQCQGLQILLFQQECPVSGGDGFGDICSPPNTAGGWYWGLYTYWSTTCNTGNPWSFFFNAGAYSPTATADLRNGAPPMAGDSYGISNGITSTNCMSGGHEDVNSWGYGGTATVTFASSCPGGGAVSNCVFHTP